MTLYNTNAMFKNSHSCIDKNSFQNMRTFSMFK